jgi:hypothetical protein
MEGVDYYLGKAGLLSDKLFPGGRALTAWRTGWNTTWEAGLVPRKGWITT